MDKDLRRTFNMFKDPNENRLQVKLPIQKKIQFINMGKTQGLKHSELIVMLINNSLYAEIENIKFFRKQLKDRISKGVGLEYIKELKKLEDDLSIYTKIL